MNVGNDNPGRVSGFNGNPGVPSLAPGSASEQFAGANVGSVERSSLRLITKDKVKWRFANCFNTLMLIDLVDTGLIPGLIA